MTRRIFSALLVYMVSDSGSGAADFYTASELTAAASELQLVGTPSPVALP